MEQQMNPTKDEIKLLIDNGLLQNNERINTAIQVSADKVTLAVNQKTDAYINQVTTLAGNQGEMSNKISSLEAKVNNLWGKMIGVGAACATLGAFAAIIWSKL